MYNKIFSILLFILAYNVSLESKVLGQKVPCNEITASMGYTVRSVRVIGRWVPVSLQNKVEGIVGLGQLFDPVKVPIAQKAISDELRKEEFQFAIKLLGATSVVYVSSDACDISSVLNPKEVEIVIRPYYLRVDLFKLGDNFLPVPHSSMGTIFSNIPESLLAVAPIFWLDNDKQYGPSISLQTKTDLLHIPGLVKSDEGLKKIRLNLELNARQSFSHSFYNYGVGINIDHSVYTNNTLGWNFGVRYSQGLQPLGLGYYKRQSTQIFAGIQGSGNIFFLNKYIIEGGGRYLQNSYNIIATSDLQNVDNGYQLHALSDGQLGNGLIRAGIWFDKGFPRKNNILRPYDRLAGRISYSTSLGNGHNHFTLEVTTGGGYTWGAPPSYNQYFAGNSARNFLYDSFTSIRNRDFPEGPIIRSLGEKEGGLNNSNNSVLGGRAYWHVNFNVSIPTIKKLITPLIPDIVISESPRHTTLRTALKGSVGTAKSAIIDDLIKQGFPDNSATDAIADQVVKKDIRPPLDYLTDRANVYAIKPLVLFDIAKVLDHDITNKIWIATGGGVQVNIVNAQLETGYMHTIYTTSYVSSGNFFVRLVLQNFY